MSTAVEEYLATPDTGKLLRKDVQAAAAAMTADEARYLVDYYYLLQEDRIRSTAQTRALGESGEPSAVVNWLAAQTGSMERKLVTVLGAYSQNQEVGRWAQSICGIGPVLSAGLLAHVDVAKAPTVGHIWRFAGLDPTTVWSKGERRPFNAKLKVLCWKIGESFVKVSGNDADIYGKVYQRRKVDEQARNAAGLYAEQAAAALVKKRFRDETQAKGHYTSGVLPPAHIHARAKRYAVNLFLSHWHAVAYRAHFGTDAPKPYILTEQGGHAHYIAPPNWP